MIHVMVTCEHGGNRVPARYARWFTAHAALLASHRGYDPGALGLARVLAARLDAPLFYTTVTRLLIEQNRSRRHPQLFSAAMHAAPAAVRDEVLARYYVPYRAAIEEHVAHAVQAGESVVHVASHSFTPELDGAVRATDIGLLYDPARERELRLCARLQAALRAHTGLVVRLNYPYRGVSDGLATALRRRFPPGAYAGMELEVNQKHVTGPAWPRLRTAIASAFADGIARFAADEAAATRAGTVAAGRGGARRGVRGSATPPRGGPGNGRRSPAAAAVRVPRAATRAGR